MHMRSDIIDAFLAESGWKNARRTVLAADASFRRYERIHAGARQAVLMDAPPDKEDIRPFIHIGEHLVSRGFSAPRIYAKDLHNGLLLLEDLGDDLYSRMLLREAAGEETSYLAAADVLAALYEQAEPADLTGFPLYDAPLLLREAGLFSEWFMPAVMGLEAAVEHAQRYRRIWEKLLPELPDLRPVLVLRDYHADNLLWLPERSGIQKVGLLDFQDAVIGSPAYDVVSFLEDARRDVSPMVVRQALARYLERTGLHEATFRAAYALMGAQRNCKIIGIFTRLAVRDGKRHYLSYLPRVWSHLAQDLRHPVLAPLARWMEDMIRPEWRKIPVFLPQSNLQPAQ